jgi:hypothetical protein
LPDSGDIAVGGMHDGFTHSEFDRVGDRIVDIAARWLRINTDTKHESLGRAASAVVDPLRSGKPQEKAFRGNADERGIG